MNNLNDLNKTFADFQSAFQVDQKAIEDGAKAVAGFGERFAAVTLGAAAKSSDIASQAARDSIANLRELSSVRDEPAAYVEAVADFSKKQFDLAVRLAEQFGAVAQETQTGVAELASAAGEELKTKATATAKAAPKPAPAKPAPAKAAAQEVAAQEVA